MAGGSASARWRSRLPWVLLLVVIAGALLWVGLRGSGTPSNAERAQALASQLRCLECQGLSVADSRTSTAVAIKTDIRRRVDAGESDAQIRQAYVDRYGEFVLLEPTSSNRVLWLLPVVVVVLGGAGIAYVVLRNARRPHFSATDADRDVVAAAREQDRHA